MKIFWQWRKSLGNRVGNRRYLGNYLEFLIKMIFWYLVYTVFINELTSRQVLDYPCSFLDKG